MSEPTRSSSTPQPRVVAAFVVLVLLVGTNLVAIRYSNRELPPFWNAGFRFALAALGFAVILAVRRPGIPARRQIAGGLLYGLLAFAGFFGFIYLGLVHAPASIGQTVLALNPLVTMFVATALGGAILLTVSAAIGEQWQLPATTGTWLAFLYLVGPGTIVVFLLLLYVLREWSATASSYQFVLAPIVSITLAATLLGEPVSPPVILGAGCVLLGVYIGAVQGRHVQG